MSRVKLAVVLAACFVFWTMLIGTSPATAEEVATCTTAVVDNTDDQLLNIPAIEAAVESANATGADVFVRAFESAPEGSLDAYWQQSISDCANWRSGTGENAVPKGNIVMVAFSMDRQSAIFFGSGYNDSIGNASATSIRDDMNEQFGGGNFTDGVILAVNDLAAAVNPDLVTSEESTAASEPINWAPFWLVGKIFFGAIFLLVVSWLVWLCSRIVRRRKDTRDWLVIQKSKAANSVTAWEDISSFVGVTFLTGGVSLPQTAQSHDYERLLLVVCDQADRAAILFQKLSVNESTNPQNKRLGADECRHAAKQFGTVIQRFDEANRQIELLRTQAAEDLKRYSFEGQAERANAVRKALDAMANKLSDYGQLFATTVASRMYQRLDAKLQRIQSQIAEQSDQMNSYEGLVVLEKEIAELSEEFDRMKSAASSLSDPRSTLQQMLQRGRSQLEAMHIPTEDEHGQLDRLDGDALDGVLDKLKATRSYDRQLAVFDTFERRIGSIVARARVRDDEYRQEQERIKRKEREKQEERRREERRQRSYSSSDSSSSGLYGAAAGAYLGSSFGSSSGSSGSDFGGGSSGGWSGGSDFGGGSSGSW